MRINILLTALIILLFCFSKSPAQDSAKDNLIHFNYTILAGSKVTVFGSTNINEFSCFSEETWENPGPELISSPLTDKATFKNAVIKIRTESLNCGNEVMNQNLCTTMESDQFPYIIIELAEASSSHLQSIQLNGQSVLSAKVYITLAGKRLAQLISVNESGIGTGIYHFTGNHRMLLSDYGIDPPKAFFGLIKVHDAITVQFDLMVSMQKELTP
ncbi:MAG: hypothetical protein ACHQD9_03275 [Chitinophagales bacterium]